VTTKADLEFDLDGILDDDMFGETVTYIIGGVEKSIRAVVYRKGTRPFPQRNESSSGNKPFEYDVAITISNDATSGIPTVTKNRDRVKIPVNLGEAAEMFVVSAVMSQDPAAWKLGLSR
jgi:hypothetical protein